jgi:hypothetical protein
VSKECPWSSSERQQTKLSLKLRRRPRRQNALDKKWTAKSINKIDKKRLPQDLDGNMTLMWLTKNWLTKKNDKGWPTKNMWTHMA